MPVGDAQPTDRRSADRAGALRALPHRPQDRRGRHGRRLPGRARAHREADRAQDPVPGADAPAPTWSRASSRRRRARRASATRTSSTSPTSASRPRGWSSSRWSTSTATTWAQLLKTERAHRLAARAPDPDADRQGAARRARARDHPPRHEAGEHLPHPARGASRLRQGARLRHRQDRHRRRGRRPAPDADRHDLRDARVHVARAGAGAAARPPRRRLRGRLHHVPDAHRRGAVHAPTTSWASSPSTCSSRRCRRAQRRPDLDIPPDVEAVCLRALEKDRDKRWQDMDAFYRALGARGRRAVRAVGRLHEPDPERQPEPANAGPARPRPGVHRSQDGGAARDRQRRRRRATPGGAAERRGEARRGDRGGVRRRHHRGPGDLRAASVEQAAPGAARGHGSDDGGAGAGPRGGAAAGSADTGGDTAGACAGDPARRPGRRRAPHAAARRHRGQARRRAAGRGARSRLAVQVPSTPAELKDPFNPL